MYAITRDALIKRINRKLVKDNKVLKVTRGVQLKNEVGDTYILDTFTGNINTHMCSDPEWLGRELGVIANWETVERVGGDHADA